MNDEMKQRLKKTDTWIQALFMLLFIFLQGVVKFLVMVIAVFQLGFVIFTGQANAQLLRLGGQLAEYAYQIINFLTLNSERRPFPFSAWPSEMEDRAKSKNQENVD